MLLCSKRLDGSADPVAELGVERASTVRGDPRETTRCGSAVCGAFHGMVDKSSWFDWCRWWAK
jgi:hypothetical protein